MAEIVAGGVPKKRKSVHKKGQKSKKKMKVFKGSGAKVKIDGKMRKLYQKRAREYNSDGDDDDEGREPSANSRGIRAKFPREDERTLEADELNEELLSEDDGDDADDEALPGITKFTEGCRAFKAAFKSIIKKSVSDESLGPILSGQKKLVAEKLAEEETEKKLKGEARKEKNLIAEKGHVKPAKRFLDAHEKFLIGVATKGVVKLFNAVNKAQNAQKGLNPSSSKDEKAIKKRRKEAFFSELGRPSVPSAGMSKVNGSSDGAGNEPPSWAPLRDNFMLTNSKLKDWDKVQKNTVEDDVGTMSEGSSSDDD